MTSERETLIPPEPEAKKEGGQSRQKFRDTVDKPTMTIPKMSGFRTIQIIGRLVFALIMKFLGLCTTALLILLLMFWLYGGVVALSLLIVAVAGEQPLPLALRLALFHNLPQVFVCMVFGKYFTPGYDQVALRH